MTEKPPATNLFLTVVAPVAAVSEHGCLVAVAGVPILTEMLSRELLDSKRGSADGLKLLIQDCIILILAPRRLIKFHC